MRIALLTDFGTRDPYVAAMKGVIASRTDAPIFDLTHEIAPFDVFEAAWFLRAVVAYWRDTVFVCVVDPGVGTSRRMVVVESGSNVFLAPDNGLLHFVQGAGRIAGPCTEHWRQYDVSWARSVCTDGGGDCQRNDDRRPAGRGPRAARLRRANVW